MKVVIDIPDKAYELLKNKSELDNIAESIIANGIPVSTRQGKWIIVDDTEKFIAKCSVCGRIEDSRMIKYHPFCHCGADMRGEEE